MFTPALIRSLHLSSAVEADLLRQFERRAPAAVPAPVTEHLSGFAPMLSKPELVASPNTTSSGAAAATSDSNADIEPAIITNRFTENGSSVDRTTTVFTKFDSNTAPQHYWASTTNGTSFPLSGYLSAQYPATRTNDPMLAENPYVSSGDFPKRTYAVGASYSVSGGSPAYSEIRVWYRDQFTSGSWSTDDQPDQQNKPVDSCNNPCFLDKPSITVSWASGSVGYVYVAAIMINSNTHTIYVYRGKKDPLTGRLGFTRVNTSITGGSTEVLSPIVAVDSNTGYVYLAWLNSSGRPSLNVARSTDFGSTFTQYSSPYTIGQPLQDVSLCNTGTNDDCHRAFSTIMARPRIGLNANDKDLGIVWHQYETGCTAGNCRTDVYFACFSLDSLTWRTSSPVHIGDQLANDGRDQWNPAIDPVGDGTYMITWYDNRENSSNRYYRVYATKMYPGGTRVDTNDTLIYNTNATADIHNVPLISGLRLFGEYQDLWEWYGTFHGGTIYVTTNEDAYVTTFVP